MKHNALEQTVHYLLKQAKTSHDKSSRGIAVQLDVAQNDVAALIGLTRAEATRILNDLKSRDLIDIEGSTVILRDEAQLRSLLNE